MSHENTEVYLVDGVRTPQGKYGGALASVRPDDLAALVVGEARRRSGARGSCTPRPSSRRPPCLPCPPNL